MHNIVANECLKLRRNKLLPVCSLIALILPLFMIAIDLVEKDSLVMTGTEWVYRLVVPIQVIVYPVLNGFVITFLIQKEYAERTIINTLTAPTNRGKFLLSKYLIWLLWSFVTTFSFLIITFAGYLAIFGVPSFQHSLTEITRVVLKTGLLSLFSMSPLLIICILQKNIFYPSLLCSCLISGIGFVGLYWPANLRNLVPWSAVTSISLLDTNNYLPYASIFICCLLGIFGGIAFFQHQNQ
ncbi:ABC transporter permease [Enterococcus sp. AZ072]|uniref:ABC transporter permease n=1 Tax=unclassified Enterococcus TaxID=2608891 RepID=UPI003D2D6D83